MTNFWEALALVDMSQTTVEHEYRLYYDPKTGTPLYYSMDDVDGVYITVSKEIYNTSRLDFKVIGGKIEYPKTPRFQLLQKGKQGTPCHPNNVMIVDQSSSIKWCLKQHK